MLAGPKRPLAAPMSRPPGKTGPLRTIARLIVEVPHFVNAAEGSAADPRIGAIPVNIAGSPVF